MFSKKNYKGLDMSEEKIFSMQPVYDDVVVEVDDFYVKFNMFEDFKDPEEYVSIISKLEKLAMKHKIVVVDVNSFGGSMATLIHLINVLKKFEIFITINSSVAESAGMLLWMAGDFKFTYPYSSFMLHRESWGFFGKTKEQKIYASHSNKIWEMFFAPILGNILTKEELEIAEYTELWLTGKDMIERKVAFECPAVNVESMLSFFTKDLIILENVLFIRKDNGNFEIRRIGEVINEDVSFEELQENFLKSMLNTFESEKSEDI